MELITDTDCDLVLNALVGSAGLGPDGSHAGGGHRPRAGQQGEPGGGRRAGDRAGRGHRRAADPRRLRALRAAPADRWASGRARSTGWCSRPAAGPSAGARNSMSVTRSRRSRTPPGRWAGKITIDSATLMNKGLELIEAHHLFGVPYERIDVVVHPQSIIHALVHLNDGASLAHLGYPDMRVPISYALHHPDRADVPVRRARPGGAGRADLRGARHSTPSPACAWRARRPRPAAPRRACSTPPTRWRCTPSCAASSASPASPG